MTAVALATAAAWVATSVGIGMWLWSWLREKDAVRRQRFGDCGLVFVAGAILLRIVAQERAMNVIDWAAAFLAPLFIAAALWRLGRHTAPRGPGA